MKIIFFIVVLANVVLFMWEYKTGAFEPVMKTDQAAYVDEEQIHLLSELDSSGTVETINLITAPETDVKTQQGTPFSSILDRPYAGQNFTTDKGILWDVMPLVLTDRAANKAVLEQNKTEAATPALQQPEASKKLASAAKQTDNATLEKAGANLTQQPATLDIVEKTDSSKTINPVICYEAGPFSSKSAYQIWLKRLNVDKEAIKAVSRDEEVISAYQVYYPAAETLTKSQANVQMLKEQGITDLFLVSTGEEQGQISLGVFTKEPRALLMQSQMLAKGIKTAIKPKYKSKLRHYALIVDKGDVMARLNVMEKNYPDMTVKKLDKCLDD